MKKMIVLFTAAAVLTACKKDEKPAETVAAPPAPPAAAPVPGAVRIEAIALGKTVDAEAAVTWQSRLP
ncbi:MAG: lipoprotein [Myxococcaceae bacterium]